MDKKIEPGALRAPETMDNCSCVDSSTPNVAGQVQFRDLNSMGKPKPTLANFYALLDYHSVVIIYSEILKDIFITFDDDYSYSEDNRREATLGRLISLMEFEGLPVRHLEQYILAVADANRINPVKDWITSRPWDGVDRLPEFYGTITTESWFPQELKEILCKKWLISLAAAGCHNPRRKAFSTRGVLTIKGPQGLGKTRWIRSVIPRDWVCDGMILDPGNKDCLMQVLSFWVVELGELESTLGTDSRGAGKLKAFLTKDKDLIRIPYAKTVSRFPRRTVFYASVNESQFLVDNTGNDRFWIIPVTEINYAHDIDIQQLFAQIHVLYEQGAEWWLNAEETRQLRRSNATFEVTDEIYDIVSTKIDWQNLEEDLKKGAVEWLNASEVLKLCGFTKIPTKSQLVSAGVTLRRLTGQEPMRKRVGNGGERIIRAYPVPLQRVAKPE